MKIHLLGFGMLCSMAGSAQWSGPSNGLLSTGNYVKISSSFPIGTPGTTYPPLFEVESTGSPADVTVFSVDHFEVVARKNFKINNAGLYMYRSTGTSSLQVLPLGNLTLNTDGYTTSNRGFFINSNGNNFFKCTETILSYLSGGTEVLKVDANVTVKGDLIIMDPTNSYINYRVYANGLVKAREVIVNLEVIPPDYVFEKSYKLLSIQEVEAYIAKNKHLPNIQSAQEMTEAGTVNLSDMQFKLLEKVEELTLYIIQLKNENELLKSRITLLEVEKQE